MPDPVPARRPPVAMPFRESETVLLAEARARFDIEQKSSANLHSKGGLYLVVVGVFAAFVGSSFTRLMDRAIGGHLEMAAATLLAISFVTLAVAAVRISSSALARGYAVIATPARWMAHLQAIRRSHSVDEEDAVADKLQHDILDAWLEAVEACYQVNEAKAGELHRVSRLIVLGAALAVAAAGLLFAQTMMKRLSIPWG